MARRLGILLLLVAAAWLAVAAYTLLFTTLMAYDDEGYVLVSLKNYCAHGGLYASVYSQYGPFFYFLHDVGHRLLGYEFTNTTGRYLTLGCWLGAAGFSAWLVWRQTRSTTWAGFTLGLTFFHLHLMISEPSHPGGLIGLLVAAGAALGAGQIQRQAWRALAVTSGLIGGALLLTKVNVGVFYLAAAGAWFVVQLRQPMQARVGSALAAVALVALPLGLMHAGLAEAPGRLYAGLSIVSSLALVAVAWRERQPQASWQLAAWGGAALLGLALVTVAAVCARGTSPAQLLEGILLGPLRHPGVYHFDPAWKPGAALAGLLSAALATLAWRGINGRLAWLIAGFRCTLALAFALACLEWLPYSAHSLAMSYLVPFAWIFAVRLEPERSPAPAGAATWLGLLLVLQYLHAYPVAGSQVAWGTFLVVPLMALGLRDAQSFVAARGPSPAAVALGGAALLLATAAAGRLGFIGWQRYAGSRPLGLPGAEDVRIPEAPATATRLMALNATAHGDLLFSLPGMFSFNQWTGLPTPTLANTTHWFSLLTAVQQEEIIAALAHSARPVFVAQRYVLDFLADSKIPVRGPLYDYLQRNFERAFSIEHFEFWVRRGRRVAPLGLVEIYELKSPAPGLAPGKLELTAAIPAGQRIARIEVVPLEGPPRVLAAWDKASGPLLATAIDLQGDAVSDKTYAAWDRPLPPLTRLTLALNPLQTFDRPRVVVHLRDAAGNLLAEARFKD
ncbi:MAG TPA: hypothetical protein VG734_18735 [Lacunisphaera sp.]|nr:hypothetical protein [Lacunisphaera sp.]